MAEYRMQGSDLYDRNKNRLGYARENTVFDSVNRRMGYLRGNDIYDATNRRMAYMRDADVFIGLSGATLPEDALARMAPGAIAFLLSNPEPEIRPEVARRHAAVVATGRSDFPNQINNVLAFPGIFAGALQVRASAITEAMKLAAAEALAAVVAGELAPDRVIPSPFDPRVAPAVTAAVAAAARAEGVARR